MRLVGRIRLGTMLLWILILGLACGLVVQWRRQEQLKATLALYRDPRAEALLDVFDEPLSLEWPDGTPLDEALKQLRVRTTGPTKLASGIPIYVDPVGLDEAEKTLMVPLQAPPSDKNLPLGEKIRRILKPLGLAYQVKDGYMMITSAASVDEPLGDAREPYIIYRDVLR